MGNRQIDERRRLDQEAFEKAFFDSAGVVIGKTAVTRMSDERIIAKAAIDRILKYYHLKPVEIPSSLKKLEEQFVTQGGMKERMHAARTGYRKGIDEELEQLRTENKVLRQRVPILEQKIEELLREKRHIEVLLQQERMKRR